MVPIYVEHWEDNLQNLPQFWTSFNIGGRMKLNHSFFRVSKSSKDQKKRSSPKLEEFLSTKSSEDQTKSSKIIQRSDADHSRIIGGYIPPGFGTPAYLPRKQISLPLTQSISKTPPLSLNLKSQGKNLCFQPNRIRATLKKNIAIKNPNSM